jgi:hypothetical protein
MMAVGLWRRSGQCCARRRKIDFVDVLDKSNHVTSGAALTTIKNVLFDADGEAILAATLWAWADIFGTNALEVGAAPPIDLVANRHGTRALDPIVKFAISHGAPCAFK